MSRARVPAVRRAAKRARCAGVVAILGVGCGNGCGKPAANQDSAPTQVTADPTSAPADGPMQESDEEEVLLPVLTTEALAARVEAQRDLLGDRDALFEDGEGKPMPWLSKHTADHEEDEVAQEMGDDILDMLPGSSGLGSTKTENARRVNGNALGLFVPVQPPELGATPLAHFHESLRALRDGKDEDGKVRVLVYGASHTDADIYPSYLRRYLQERFGDGGHGFVHLAKPWRWYRHLDMGVDSSKGWRTEHAQKKNAREDGAFGLMGCSMSSGRRSDWSRVFSRNETPGSRYELYFLAQPRGGSFALKVDGKKVATVKTRADERTTGYHVLELAEAPHEIDVRPVGNGEVRLFGMTVERAQEGVVVDTLGIGGTRAANHLEWDEEMWAEQVRRRAPDLYMLAYGTNETMDEDQSIGVYEANLRAVLERFQVAAPRASCVIVGPGDFPRKIEDGGWAPRPRLAQIVAVQRKVSAEMGCGFWDTLAFMGGPMSMPTWITANPPMARNDGIHFTRRGYVRMGMGLTDAIMVEFDAEEPFMRGARAGGNSPR